VRGRGTALKIYGTLIFLFLYFPMVIVLLFSFSPTRTIVGLSGLTLKWYQELFQDPGLLAAFSSPGWSSPERVFFAPW
jgi:spermidine/putrescine transport system permease protein